MIEIPRQDINSLPLPDSAEIHNAKHLSSYNWVESPSPTIVVPGSPSLWLPLNNVRRVAKDSGQVYINQNAARHPESPFEPLFRALFMTHPSFDICSTDIVTDRNNLRKLLSFVDDTSVGQGLESFTIHVEHIQDTALLSRVERCNSEYIRPGEFRGFGHEFEKAQTRALIPGTTGHHRVISYNLGGLELIVRYETDGYEGAGPEPMSFKTAVKTESDSISDTLESLSLSSRKVSAGRDRTSLLVLNGGHVVPNEQTLEIKTRTSYKPIVLRDVAPQLWLSQTPKLVRAYHQRGLFQRADVENVATEIKAWEKGNQTQLRRLVGLIQKILIVSKQCGGKAIVYYDSTRETLSISKSTERNMLPEDLRNKWTSTGSPTSKPTSTVQTSTQSNPETPTVEIQVGASKYLVQLDKMPYFKSLARERDHPSNHGDPLVFTNAELPLFDVVHRGLAKGPREFLRIMPSILDEYRTLCRTLGMLKIDIIGGRDLRAIMQDFRSGKSDWDPEDRREVSGQKRLARDSAFRLVHTFLSPQAVAGVHDSNMAFNATFFVLSHKRIFHCRTRRIVRLAFEDQFRISEKQRANMDKWPIEDPHSGTFGDDDSTTDSGGNGFYDYDSD